MTAGSSNDPETLAPDASESALNPIRTDLQTNGEVTHRPRTQADANRVAVASKMFDLISSGEWVLPVQSVENTAGQSILLTFPDESRMLIALAALSPDAELESELEDAWSGEDARETS